MSAPCLPNPFPPAPNRRNRRQGWPAFASAPSAVCLQRINQRVKKTGFGHKALRREVACTKKADRAERSLLYPALFCSFVSTLWHLIRVSPRNHTHNHVATPAPIWGRVSSRSSQQQGALLSALDASRAFLLSALRGPIRRAVLRERIHKPFPAPPRSGGLSLPRRLLLFLLIGLPMLHDPLLGHVVGQHSLVHQLVCRPGDRQKRPRSTEDPMEKGTQDVAQLSEAAEEGDAVAFPRVAMPGQAARFLFGGGDTHH